MTIKNSTVTREQYDKLQVDLVNRIEELEQTVDRLEEAVSGVNRSHRSLEQTVERLVTATAETMTNEKSGNKAHQRLVQANNNRHFEIRVVGIIAIVGFVTGLAGVLNLALN